MDVQRASRVRNRSQRVLRGTTFPRFYAVPLPAAFPQRAKQFAFGLEAFRKEFHRLEAVARFAQLRRRFLRFPFSTALQNGENRALPLTPQHVAPDRNVITAVPEALQPIIIQISRGSQTGDRFIQTRSKNFDRTLRIVRSQSAKRDRKSIPAVFSYGSRFVHVTKVAYGNIPDFCHCSFQLALTNTKKTKLPRERFGTPLLSGR